MEMLLGSSNPAARMQIADHLTVLWNSARPLMWELAERVARRETNRGVLRFFAKLTSPVVLYTLIRWL